MRLSAQEEYGLRCLLQVAREPEGGLTTPQLAEREGLGAAHVHKLMRLLRRGGLVKSVRGRNGGYQLARPAEQVRLRHRHRGRRGSPRVERGDCPAHLREEERARVYARVAPARLPPLADDEGAALAERPLSAHRLPGHRLLLRAEAEGRGPQEPRGGRSRAAPGL